MGEGFFNFPGLVPSTGVDGRKNRVGRELHVGSLWVWVEDAPQKPVIPSLLSRIAGTGSAAFRGSLMVKRAAWSALSEQCPCSSMAFRCKKICLLEIKTFLSHRWDTQGFQSSAACSTCWRKMFPFKFIEASTCICCCSLFLSPRDPLPLKDLGQCSLFGWVRVAGCSIWVVTFVRTLKVGRSPKVHVRTSFCTLTFLWNTTHGA